MPRNRSRKPQDERSSELVSWRVKPEIGVLLEQAAMIRGWPLSRVLEEGAVQRALEICADALRGLARIRRANRKAKARIAGLARQRGRRA